MPIREAGLQLKVGRALPVSASVSVPGSKSLTNRFLLLAALAEGETVLRYPLQSDDTVYMRQALESIGCQISEEDQLWRVVAPKQWQDPKDTLFVGNAGTAMRFLTPALSAKNVRATITGNERMQKRPIADLVDGLRALGAEVDYLGEVGYPPLGLRAPLKPGRVEIRGDASSQYLSGLLMALPLLPGSTEIVVTTPLVSETYVEMTLACMAELGVTLEHDPSFRTFSVQGNQRYQARELVIEPDASTASYWFALPLMVGGEIEVQAVPKTSQQGDFGLVDIFEQMGATVVRTATGLKISKTQELVGIDVDMNTRSDVAPTLAVVATCASSPTLIRNVGNMRIKECDRIACIQAAFDGLGLRMESGPDWMKIYPGAPKREAQLCPEEDHRMAMIFTLLGLTYGGVTIEDPNCVAKTYPDFYEELSAVLKAV